MEGNNKEKYWEIRKKWKELLKEKMKKEKKEENKELRNIKNVPEA